jgi:hypothetical protein
MHDNEVGTFVMAKYSNAFIKVREVNFGKKSASKFTTKIGTAQNENVSMEIRLDTKDGALLGTVNVPMTGGNDKWTLQTIDVKKVSGIHDLYFVFKGKSKTDILYFDYWKFLK